MIYRFSCAAVVVFWVVMTVLLVNRSYFSSEDHLPVVRSEHVIDLFIKNPNSSDLYVYRGKKQVGSLSIIPRELEDGRIELQLTALGKIDFLGLDAQDVVWRGELELTPQHDVVHFDLVVKFRHPRVNVALEIDPETFEIAYQVMQDGEILIDSDDEKSKAVRRVKKLLSLSGMSPKALKRKEARRESPDGKQSTMVARYGKMIIGGERLLLYFSEVGELVKIGPVLGYDVLSSAFAPPARAGGIE